MIDDKIKYIARKAAAAGLNLKDARALFDALYVSDAIMLAGGSKTKAAKIAGVRREHMHRLRNKSTVEE